MRIVFIGTVELSRKTLEKLIDMQKKLEMMRIYKSEIGEHPFPCSKRNLKALATIRGVTSACEYAESLYS